MYPSCPYCDEYELKNGSKTLLHGSYFRPSDSRTITRYRCKECNRTFSKATFDLAYQQNKRRINHPLKKLLCSGVSQRRAALLLKINRKTVARKLKFLGLQARLSHERFLSGSYAKAPISLLQFDDLITIEHTKCKPLSITLAVEANTRKILGFEISSMPATGHLAQISRKKYGFRKDERKKGIDHLLKKISVFVDERASITSDSNPFYKSKVKKHFHSAYYTQVKGGRGCISGQGELKKLHFDPLFSLNHTCAMLRANINRLFRRTWCTTKKIEGLMNHLSIYMSYHNQVLT